MITRAPLSTAQRIARASAFTPIARSGPTTFATSSCADGARPAMPMPLSRTMMDRPREEWDPAVAMGLVYWVFPGMSNYQWNKLFTGFGSAETDVAATRHD